MKKLIKSEEFTDTYGNTFVFYARGTKKDAIDDINRFAEEEIDPAGESRGFFIDYISKDFPYFAVWIGEVDYSNTFYSILSHEMFHATYCCLKHRGVSLCYESEEAFAYHISWLTRMYLDWITKKVRRK